MRSWLYAYLRAFEHQPRPPSLPPSSAPAPVFSVSLCDMINESSSGLTTVLSRRCSYIDFSDGSEQKEWLKQELAEIDRNVTPWVFAVVHAPWYNSNYAHVNEPPLMRYSLEQVSRRILFLYCFHKKAN